MNFPKTPQVGDIVLFTPNPDDTVAKSNYNTGRIAAIITRVWGPQMVNLKIIPDNGPMQDRSSVGHFSLYPEGYNSVGYNWRFGDDRDAVPAEEQLHLMQTSVFSMLDPNSPNINKDCELVSNFFDGLRTKSKIQRDSID